jgi:hypothetical protein
MIAPNQISADSNVWPIERWDDVEIVSEPIDAVCIRTTLHVNRATGSVTKLSVPKINVGVCKGGHEVLVNLVDGEHVWMPHFKKYFLERQRIERGHWEQFERQWHSPAN